jgi:hypothetical protein
LIPLHAPTFDHDFVAAEWRNVILPQGLTTWADYRAAQRTGRGKSITVRDRKSLWTVFEALRERLLARNQLDWAAICQKATAALKRWHDQEPLRRRAGRRGPGSQRPRAAPC